MSAAAEQAAQNMRTSGSSGGKRGLSRGDSLASTWNQSNFLLMQDEQTIAMINQINGNEGEQVEKFGSSLIQKYATQTTAP